MVPEASVTVTDLVPWVWCACHARCGGIGVPGYVVRGTLELCVACAEKDRTEREGRKVVSNPVTVTQNMSLREIATGWKWTTTVQMDPLDPSRKAFKPDDATICAGALLELINMQRTAEADHSSRESMLRQALARIQSLLTPAAAAKPDPAADRERHLAECRARSWAAYKAAGGTMTLIANDNPQLLDRPVSVLDLPVRARKAMDRLNIHTLGELAQRTADELLEGSNFGMTSLTEVRERLGRLDLKLQGD